MNTHFLRLWCLLRFNWWERLIITNILFGARRIQIALILQNLQVINRLILTINWVLSNFLFELESSSYIFALLQMIRYVFKISRHNRNGLVIRARRNISCFYWKRFRPLINHLSDWMFHRDFFISGYCPLLVFTISGLIVVKLMRGLLGWKHFFFNLNALFGYFFRDLLSFLF